METEKKRQDRPLKNESVIWLGNEWSFWGIHLFTSCHATSVHMSLYLQLKESGENQTPAFQAIFELVVLMNCLPGQTSCPQEQTGAPGHHSETVTINKLWVLPLVCVCSPACDSAVERGPQAGGWSPYLPGTWTPDFLSSWINNWDRRKVNLNSKKGGRKSFSKTICTHRIPLHLL